MDKNFLDHERFTKLRDLINVSALDDERSVDSYFEGILRGASKRTPKGADITFSSSERESLWSNEGLSQDPPPPPVNTPFSTQGKWWGI